MLTLLVSRKLHRLVRRLTQLPLERLPLDRWARVFAGHAAHLLDLLAAPSRRTEDRRAQVPVLSLLQLPQQLPRLPLRPRPPP